MSSNKCLSVVLSWDVFCVKGENETRETLQTTDLVPFLSIKYAKMKIKAACQTYSCVCAQIT